MMRLSVSLLLLASCQAFVPQQPKSKVTTTSSAGVLSSTDASLEDSSSSRRSFLSTTTATVATSAFGGLLVGLNTAPQSAEAIGPVKVTLIAKSYSAVICPPDKPIPGEKAMTGMKGLCVTVVADLKEQSPKELEKVGVYGFVTDGISGESVLANNPDLSTDAGQFTMIEKITTSDKTITFEFIAAVPKEKDLSKYENGIGPLDFESLRVISYPGGQQFGAISPCEMNEFSDECDVWVAENGPYVKQEYMIKSNSRTKGS
jgi:hypothetical protein